MKKICLLLALLTSLIAPAAFGQAVYGNNQSILLASAARTAATVNSTDQLNTVYKGGHFIVNISAYTAGTYTPHIQAKDPISGNYYDILVGTALNATGTTILKVYPGITASANAAASDLLPRTWRVQLIGASANMTLSVSAFLEQ